MLLVPWTRGGALLLAALLLLRSVMAEVAKPSLALPVNGSHSLQIISPSVLEITAIVAGPTQPPPDGSLPPRELPPLKPVDFEVTVEGQKIPVAETGFRRRVAYAPLKRRDLRIDNAIYLRLGQPIGESKIVEVRYHGAVSWLDKLALHANADPQRLSPVIHVNQVGYLPDGPKAAIVGYYLGSLGELDLDRPSATDSSGVDAAAPASLPEFQVVDNTTGRTVFSGKLAPRRSEGFPMRWYQHLATADFSEFRTPGEYRLVVRGLGASYPFFIDDGIAGAFARTLALGLYEQRCGTTNVLPWTRFTHDACHTAPAEIPTPQFKATEKYLDQESNDHKDPKQTAPRLRGVEASLFPFVQHGKIDVSGGHHDAGDYSKYTANSAALVHLLMFAVDNFAGVAALDNLGIPESGDGVSDLLQEAKWESDFLAKMQDDDGGFYFLVYPRERDYEVDVLPDHGDSQVVWPKTTAVTAAATAALAQCASSPLFKKQYPKEAATYLEKARRGWKFLRAAAAKYGEAGAYQKITHYGDWQTDQDEIAWAAVELFLATGEPEFEREIMSRLRPRDPDQRRYGWRRLNEAYGNATRSYAFAARSGRIEKTRLHPRLLRDCENEIIACAEDWVNAAQTSGYGVSYPEPMKRVLGGGWFFAADQTFDLAVAAQLDFPSQADRRPVYRAAIISNIDYEAGCNPVNVSYLTGLGWKRPLEIVHQYAQNDRRALPLSGIVQGSIQEGFTWLPAYKAELGAISYPLDGGKDLRYPILDRWSDTFNLQAEFVVVNQARALTTAAWLMAQSPLKNQPWRGETARIEGAPTTAKLGQPIKLEIAVDNLDLARARIIWEGRANGPVFAREFTFVPKDPGEQWVEVEAQAVDGRRIFAAASFSADAPVVLWVNGALPEGAKPSASGGDNWGWIKPATKPPELRSQAGVPQHESALADGIHDHSFENAESPLAIRRGDILFAYVFIDPAHIPKMIMLEWNDGSWEHRAFWGQNLLAYGESGTASRRPMGALPPMGRWVRLEVPASAVGLEGRSITGMTFRLHSGRARWDAAGRMTAAAKRMEP